MLYASIQWDEENSPNPFYRLSAISELLLFVTWCLMRGHQIPSGPLLQATNPSGVRFLGFVVLVVCLTAIYLYFNLVINGIWRQNPSFSGESDDEVRNEEDRPSDKGIFASSLSNSIDPIITRDEIQWNRIIPGTLAAGVMVLTFIWILLP